MYTLITNARGRACPLLVVHVPPDELCFSHKFNAREGNAVRPLNLPQHAAIPPGLPTSTTIVIGFKVSSSSSPPRRFGHRGIFRLKTKWKLQIVYYFYFRWKTCPASRIKAIICIHLYFNVFIRTRGKYYVLFFSLHRVGGPQCLKRISWESCIRKPQPHNCINLMHL
jgi:hypothetical protein